MPQSRKFLQGLNPSQREAVRHTEGPVLVLAGAGSGKTRVITQRIAHILASQLAVPSEILAVTFTNKAAVEMRERVADLVGKKIANTIVISTFHSYCLQVLRKHISHLGYRKNFSIAGDSDSRTLLRRVVEDLGSTESFNMGTFQSQISLLKNANEAPDPDKPPPVETENEEKYSENLAVVYESYQSALRAANSVDFDDLMLLTLRLWNEHPAMHAQCRDAFKYVMVDEYQDTNKVQYELIRKLVSLHRNLCVVGDDDQSIYGWRGADSSIILDFDKHYTDAKVITLDQNYRSTETILKAANAVIAHNTARKEKKLWSELGKGRLLDWIICSDEEAEADEALKWMKFIQDRTGARYSDFAYLYRSNQQSRPLEVTLRQAGIPYIVVGGQDFFERAEVRDIISYLKVIVNPRDEAAFLRVVNMPRRGVGDATLHKIHELCRDEKLSLGQATAELLKRGIDGGPTQMALDTTGEDRVIQFKAQKVERGLRDFLALLSKYRKRFKEKKSTLRRIVEDLINDIDYHGEIERSCKTPQQASSRWNNVEVVVKAIGDYEEKAESPSLSGFLDESHLNTDQSRFDKDDRKKSGVTLQTIHSAKGLEFPFVFLMGVEDGLMPHERSIKENTIEEERRLFYVALTRGKRHVTMFETLSRVRNGKERMSKTSRFLDEVPSELYKKHIKAVRQMVEDKVAPPEPKKKKPRPNPDEVARTNRRAMIGSIIFGSIVVHGIALVLFGIWTVAQHFRRPEARFEMRKVVKIPPKTPEHKMNVAQHEAMAPKPGFNDKLISARPTEFALP
ncbi:MAG: UvrD-helicase domain-containing protein, partial [Candidatus Hydrogenedentes bacterium]|nr:UvrD-helicase domain-containing protein [Candidatus Hydrogenedentota bacterium]